jgi:hypothetical protein
MPTHHYKYKYGPWPQPNPDRPDELAPMVLHVPEDQAQDWLLKIGARYATELVATVVTAPLAAAAGQLESVPDDDTFERLLTHGVYTKLLNPTVRTGPHDPRAQDERPFDALVFPTPADTRFWKIDLSAMGKLEPYEGMYVAPTRVLLAERDGHRKIRAIVIGDDPGLLLEPIPAHRNAFDLAKLFVLQGAAYAILFTEHPNLHFPFDAINAITQTYLPTDHVAYKLLSPHLRFQLELNYQVLEGRFSVISQDDAQQKPQSYDPFTASRDDGLVDLFIAGYRGIPGHSGYPPYDFSQRPRLPSSSYGDFLRGYHEPILAFTRAVVPRIPPDQRETLEGWAHHCATSIPGFPGREAVQDNEVLARTLAHILWNLTVGHAADHAAFARDISPELKFMRIRVPPPTHTHVDPVEMSSVTTLEDGYRLHRAHKVFFEPALVTRLIDVDYEFSDPSLTDLENAFKVALHEASANAPHTWLALADIPASIQY